MSFLFSKSSTTSTTATTSTTTTVLEAEAEPEIAIAVPIETTMVVESATAVAEQVPNSNEANKTEGNEKMEVEEELEKMPECPTNSVDLVFMLDCTASMGSYIEEGKRSIQSIVDRLSLEQKVDVRFSLIAYRDHPPQDSTFVTKIFKFTNDKREMQKYLNCCVASGGGDGPEAVTAALFAAENLDWRPNAAKVSILIADAPPHGLGESGDGFPNGDPDGLDPLVIARSMASKGITIYPVGCEPALSGYKNARAFMVGLAEITEGYATSLSSSTLLADIILGSTAEEIGLQALATKYEAQIDEIRVHVSKTKGTEASDTEVANELFNRMKMENVQTVAWKCDGKISDSRGAYFSKNARLADARSEILAKEPSGSVKNSCYDEEESADSIHMLGGCAPPPPACAAAPGAARASYASGSTSWGRSGFASFGFGGSAFGRKESSGPIFGASPPPKPPSSSATVSEIAREDVSMEQANRVFNKAMKKQGKLF